jgi:phenylacetate-CoA ligase
MDGVSHLAAETSFSNDFAEAPQLDQTAISTGAPQTVTAPNRLQFWEAEHTRPDFQQGGEENADLINVANSYLDKCMAHPYLPVEEIRAQQFARIKELVEMAYREIPVYRAKYKKAGFKPSHLKTYDDIQKIPVITKPELVAAFPDQCVNRKF